MVEIRFEVLLVGSFFFLWNLKINFKSKKTNDGLKGRKVVFLNVNKVCTSFFEFRCKEDISNHCPISHPSKTFLLGIKKKKKFLP